ncbi:MAG: amidase [Comamonadaceae bacterium]|nr:MAG: amidase [Comamonadaceae bacterium]
MFQDLQAARAAMRDGAITAREQIERCIAIAQAPACHEAFIRTSFDSAWRDAVAADPSSLLGGLAFSVKDLFDVAGEPTAAGSVVLAHAPPAPADAVAVARLRAAGGAMLGRTNMTEFAFSGVGINPHHGTPRNVSDSAVPRVPGGSSSGAAVSVATGAAFVGLGSDTGGSIRIPAALNGIVGFKSTARLVPAAGALPLSTTLDTIAAMTRSVRDAILVHEILAARQVKRGLARLDGTKLAVVTNLFHDGMDPIVTAAFRRALLALRGAGAHVEEIELPCLDELSRINATGGFSAAESYAWHRLLLERSGAGYDPRVAARILRGAAMKAHEYIDLMQARRSWIAGMEADLSPFHAVLSPTVPIVAPTIASVAPGEERDEEFFRVNALLLRNPSVVNMLDGCAVSLPCHASGSLPCGLMIWHAALHDDAVLNIAELAEAALNDA